MTIYVFDLGGVLINLNVARCMHAFEELMGEQNMRTILGMDSRGEGVKAVSVASKQLMVDFEQGLISTDTFVQEVLAYCRPGTTPQQVIDAWMAMLEDLPSERLAFIDDLRSRGYKTYLLSNGNDLHFEFIDRTYNLSPRFDALFLSQKMHMAKPDPEIYRAVHQAIHPAPDDEIIFIDDLELNRLSAEKTVPWHTYSSIASLSPFLFRHFHITSYRHDVFIKKSPFLLHNSQKSSTFAAAKV